MMVSFISLLLLLFTIFVASGERDTTNNTNVLPKRPELYSEARVREHRSGSNGEVLQHEEHLRKLIVAWDPYDDAEMYEICYMCWTIDDETGIQKETRPHADGRIYEIPTTQTCGGHPCFILEHADYGYNQFHLRVKAKSGAWSVWSKHRNYEVTDDIGYTEHIDAYSSSSHTDEF